MTNSAPKYSGDLATDLDYQGPMSHVDALSSAPKEIELPALVSVWEPEHKAIKILTAPKENSNAG